jgi:hypothetical protein
LWARSRGSFNIGQCQLAIKIVRPFCRSARPFSPAIRAVFAGLNFFSWWLGLPARWFNSPAFKGTKPALRPQRRRCPAALLRALPASASAVLCPPTSTPPTPARRCWALGRTTNSAARKLSSGNAVCKCHHANAHPIPSDPTPKKRGAAGCALRALLRLFEAGRSWPAGHCGHWPLGLGHWVCWGCFLFRARAFGFWLLAFGIGFGIIGLASGRGGPHCRGLRRAAKQIHKTGCRSL